MANEPESRLLKLAAELRNRIYDMVFEDHAIDWDDHKPAAPGILLACKHTHTEAIGAYYDLSTFFCKYSPAARQHLSRLPSKHSHAIKKVCLGEAKKIHPAAFWEFEDLANDAQISLLRVQELVKENGYKGLNKPGAVEAVMWVRTSTSGDEIVRTAEPWREFASQMTEPDYADMERLRGDYQEALRFFDHEHEVPSACWGWNWRTILLEDCGCPLKAK
ncbi:hypothetical protein PRZ48_014176 [Zasmidium cellare]|uniref:Uncharacterized protein n=1 Tax=Zasmidium cellare TaxID=395010 RepID=A0ABR0E071_ZASCE|nr:hypothetical protein PRZ48_014176 [Zasmidium cellare]